MIMFMLYQTLSSVLVFLFLYQSFTPQIKVLVMAKHSAV